MDPLPRSNLYDGLSAFEYVKQWFGDSSEPEKTKSALRQHVRGTWNGSETDLRAFEDSVLKAFDEKVKGDDFARRIKMAEHDSLVKRVGRKD